MVSVYQVIGKQFVCSHCDGVQFVAQKTFVALRWERRPAMSLICERCGYVHTFLDDQVVQAAGEALL